MSPLSARFEIEILKNSSKCTFFSKFLLNTTDKMPKFPFFPNTYYRTANINSLQVEIKRLLQKYLSISAFFDKMCLQDKKGHYKKHDDVLFC